METPIYRYKFTEDFSTRLYNFAKIHEYDDRATFKEAWEEWSRENDETMENETQRIIMLGYKGNIIQKMFKSARYYYRKKGTKKKAPTQPRKTYVSLPDKILKDMDLYIQSCNKMKPSESFHLFCEENPEILRENAEWFQQNGYATSEEIHDKIKKTYKNRHFIAFHFA